ncbi:minichromosome maintenance protein MCM [Haloferax profundi]|uniref:minichromosome maintenance protein MCM n=1 Tax=Haloferax profundi TaxID=1544718 RepID=UPI0009E770B7|nr:minichromosome maintenance protein MCM [Haloferax profundi]
MTSEREYGPDDFEQMATSYDMFERIAVTLDRPDIDGKVVHAVTLQLVGAPAIEQGLGEDIRGNIHLAIISDATANLSRFISAVIDLAPQQTAHLNGTKTSPTGAIGNVTGGNLSPGPLLDENVELTVIEQMDSASTKLQNAFQQILDTGKYSITKSKFRGTVDAPGSVLIAKNPKYGTFDQYEPIGEQIDLTPAVTAAVDLSMTNVTKSASELETSEEPLPPSIAREYISFARSNSPSLSTEAREEIKKYVEGLVTKLEDSGLGGSVGTVRLQESLVRFSLAHARLSLSTQASAGDAKRAIQLVQNSLRDLGVDPETGSFDGEIVETGRLNRENKQPKNLLESIRKLNEEHSGGVPLDEIHKAGKNLGLSTSETNERIEKLMTKADIYTIAEDLYRPT